MTPPADRGHDDPYRLPRTVSPTRYTLTLEPDLVTATFRGEVVVALEVHEHSDRILLNAAELDIVSVEVAGMPAPFELDEKTERLQVAATVRPGPETMRITFAGVLNDMLKGWYRSTYRDANGAERVIATSQMQPTDCRRAFPCWDEPDFKAVFDVTLVVEPDQLAVSNGAEVGRTVEDDGRHAVRFSETMPMSTYLVALVVGPLEATAPVAVPLPEGGDGAIPLRVVNVPGKGHLTAYALETGAAAIRWYQDFYGIAYPSDKCDMVALPDFAAGAMENLGCITYRENLLLLDPSTSTQFEQQTLVDVVAHELAHMWFGDLVTMKWWNGIWLNEAFATFMELACCDALRPDWKRWTSFSLERTVAFETDSLVSTRSVEFPVYAPHDCEGMFDVLTYQKGAALLRMLQQYLGEEEFRRGVNLYLHRHTYGNTETSDLWDALEDANPSAPVRRLMDSWIWQPGFPLISARLDGSDLVLSQQRFTFGDPSELGAAAATLFVVPLHVRVGGNEHKVLLDGDTTRVPLDAPDAPVVVNAGGHGFVRVAYDAALRGRLAGAALRELTTVERYNLIDDAWNAVVAGRLAAAEFVTFVEGFADEQELAVWQAMAMGLRGIGRILDGEPYAAFQGRVRRLVGPALDRLGWTPAEGEDDLTSKLRGLLVSALAVLGDDRDAQARCRALLDSPDGVDPELVATATAVVAASGTEEDFDRYVDRFRTAPTPQEQLRFLYALGEFPGAEQIRRACDFAFSGEVKTQNAPFLLARCIANRDNGALAWSIVRQRWDAANERFPGNTIVRMIDPVKLLTRPTDVADVQSFFAEHEIPQSAKTLDQILERQRVNAALREREQARLAATLTAP